MKSYLFTEMEKHVHRYNILMPVDVLVVGATGTGKSSTLNAIFGSTVAKVGTGSDPETQHISAHGLHNYIRFHDSPGLGDGKEADAQHAKNITKELLKTIFREDFGKAGFIDLAMVLLDGSTRDMGTTFKLLESVVLKCIEPERVVVAINQADMAMKGRYWNSHRNLPEPELEQFLEHQADSVKKRIFESTGLRIQKPIYYSAAFNYKINNLMQHLLMHFPHKRRII